MTELFAQHNPILNTANNDYVGMVENGDYKPGRSIDIRIPGYPVGSTGQAVTAEAVEDRTVSYALTWDDVYNVPRELDLLETKLDMDGWKGYTSRYVLPAYYRIANMIERRAVEALQEAAYLTPIDSIAKLTKFTTYSDVSEINNMANKMKWAVNERTAVLNNDDSNSIANALQNSFNEVLNKNISMNQRVGGPEKGRLAGLDMFESSDMFVHTAGPSAERTGVTVKSVSTDGTQIVLQGLATSLTGAIKKGDRIAIPSVKILQNVSREPLDYNLVVVATADADSDGSGDATITVSRPLIASGEHANVSALPAASAPVEIFPSHKLNFCYTKSGLSAIPLVLGDIYSAVMSNFRAPAGKVTTRIYQQGDVKAFENVHRMSTFVAIKGFADYIIVRPSKV